MAMMVTMMMKQIVITVGVHLPNVPREFIVIQIIITPRDVHVLLSQFLSILFIPVLVVMALLLLLFGCTTYGENSYFVKFYYHVYSSVEQD